MYKVQRQRPGFTLIELLVVITIIAILIAFSFGGVMRVRTSQQVRSSEDIVEKVQLAVDNQYKAITAQAYKEISGGGTTPEAQSLINYMGGDTDAAQALLTYCRIRQNFPQTFAEVQLAPNGTLLTTTVPNGPAVTYFTIPGSGAYFFTKSNFLPFASMAATNLTPSQQSAALLYAAVADTGTGGITFDAVATNTAHFDFTPKGGGTTIHSYKDAFNQPIGFCRFGTNVELQVTNAGQTINGVTYPVAYANPNATYNATYKVHYQDTLDPSGKLFLWTQTHIPNAGASGAASVIFVHNGDPANATSFNSTHRRPVVYSTGYNTAYESLNQAAATTPYPALDDILGYRLTQLGQRGTKK